MTDLADLTRPDLADPALLAVPVGATEQHGPHLPLDTDTRIASAIAERVCGRSKASGLLCAPDLNYGASGEHEGFAGTISIGHEALRGLLVEYGRSACRWAARRGASRRLQVAAES